MPDVKTQLTQEAICIANGFSEKKRGLDKQKLDLQTQLAVVKAQFEATDLAIDRLNSFRVTIDGEYQCPRCWIAQGVSAPLIPQPSDTSQDWFKCRVCHHEFSF